MPPKQLKPCPEGKERNPKTNRCNKVKVEKRKKKQEWTEQVEKEFHQMLADLRRPKLGGVFSQKVKQENCPKCIKQAKTQQLQKELQSRKKIVTPTTPPKVNILIPRKKVKKPVV